MLEISRAYFLCIFVVVIVSGCLGTSLNMIAFNKIYDIAGNIRDLIEKDIPIKLKMFYLNSVRFYRNTNDPIVDLNDIFQSNNDPSIARTIIDKNIPSMKTSFLDGLRIRSGSDDKKRILILISDTGGGHRASAQAIDQAISNIHKNKIDVSILDIWTDYANWPFNRFVPTYRFLAKHPLLWRLFYAYGAFPPTKLMTEQWSKLSSYASFKSAIMQRNPDLVVSVHPLCQLMPLSIVDEINRSKNSSQLKVPFVTVVTDLGGAHTTWFDKRADYVFVPSKEVRSLARRCGIDKSKIIMRGLPIRPAFWKRAPPKRDLRKKLGLEEESKTVLIMGGGDGVGKLYEISCEIGKKLGTMSDRAQLIVICGHNKGTADSLKSRIWPASVKVHVKGFIDNIDEFMGASDCLVTKAGPGTIAEAMTRGLPVVLSSYLPGQEAGNVPYVVKRQFGVYTGLSPQRIAKNVYELCVNPHRLEEMSDRALAFSFPKATEDIAKDLSKLIFRKSNEIPVLK